MLKTTRITKNYLVTLVSVPTLLMLALITAMTLFPAKLPAPRFSNSLAFNEKARWMRNAVREKCTTLIVGSSMAFNNIDAKLLPVSRFGNHVVNVGSWGMSVIDSLKMTKIVAPICKPETVVLVTNFMDFNSRWDKNIDWNMFENFIQGKSNLLDEFLDFDINYFITTLQAIRDSQKKNKSNYESIEFDDTGTVNFQCSKFNIAVERWEAINQSRSLDKESVLSNIQALKSLAEYTKNQGVKMYVLTPPLRDKIENNLFVVERRKLWNEVARIVVDHGGEYIFVSGSQDYDDSMFVDYAHLNACGAEKFTRHALHLSQHDNNVRK